MPLLPHALPESASPLLGLVFCVNFSPTYSAHAMFGLRGLKNAIGELCLVCCNPVFKGTTFDALNVETELMCLKMHRIDLEKEAEHCKLIKPIPPRHLMFILKVLGTLNSTVVTNNKSIIGQMHLMVCFLLLQAELTFCAGDVITVFGEIDEDGFYYVSADFVFLC